MARKESSKETLNMLIQMETPSLIALMQLNLGTSMDRASEQTKAWFVEAKPKVEQGRKKIATLAAPMSAETNADQTGCRELGKKFIALYGVGKYAEAARIGEELLQAAKVAFGPEHSQYATCVSNLAEAYRCMGEYAKAESLHQQACAICKKALGEDHPDYATSLNNLAELYRCMGECAKAEPLYRQSLAIRKKALGENHPHYAQSLNNFAGLYMSMDEYAKAEPLFQQASAILKKSLVVQPDRDYQS
jgi:tetratricopeptide (TPR) repeat protein